MTDIPFDNLPNSYQEVLEEVVKTPIRFEDLAKADVRAVGLEYGFEMDGNWGHSYYSFLVDPVVETLHKAETLNPNLKIEIKDLTTRLRSYNTFTIRASYLYHRKPRGISGLFNGAPKNPRTRTLDIRGIYPGFYEENIPEEQGVLRVLKPRSKIFPVYSEEYKIIDRILRGIPEDNNGF